MYKTNLLHNDRSSFLLPCPNSISVQDSYASKTQWRGPTVRGENAGHCTSEENLGHSVFERSREDDKEALSIDDKDFLAIMDAEVKQDEGNSWVAPLPFRSFDGCQTTGNKP